MATDKPKNSLQKQLNAGATSLVLLSLLQQQRCAMYGYEVAKELESRSVGPLPMKPGAIYPVLRSLEKQGLLSSYLESSDSGPARRYYQITTDGKSVLKQWRTAWQDTKHFVDTFLEKTDESSRRRRGKSVSQEL